MPDTLTCTECDGECTVNGYTQVHAVVPLGRSDLKLNMIEG
jgi:hypothetical protein